MKLGIVCTVGNLDRYGYQNVYRECIESFLPLGDAIYLVSSTESDQEARELASEHSKIRLISGPHIWFSKVDGREYFSLSVIEANMGIGTIMARLNDCDATLFLCANWYVPETSIDGLRHRCEVFVESDMPFGWLYRRYQLADKVFGIDNRLPYLVKSISHEYIQEGIRVGNEEIYAELGDFGDRRDECVVDVQMETNLEDLEAKSNFMRCYADVMPKRNPVFAWEYWKEYHLNKYRRRGLSDDPLDPIGARIAAASKPEYVSLELLREL